MKKISVIGSGSWGTALAVMFDKYGRKEASYGKRSCGKNVTCGLQGQAVFSCGKGQVFG